MREVHCAVKDILIFRNVKHVILQTLIIIIILMTVMLAYSEKELFILYLEKIYAIFKQEKSRLKKYSISRGRKKKKEDSNFLNEFIFFDKNNAVTSWLHMSLHDHVTSFNENKWIRSRTICAKTSISSPLFGWKPIMSS